MLSEQYLTSAELLAILEKPLPDYEKLATRAKQIHDALSTSDIHSVEHGLAAFCFIFGRSYAFWQQNYHYNTIHEYFFAAYRLAVHWGGDDLREETPLATLLLAFSRSMIYYTRCENAVIANDAQLLSTSAALANDWAQKGILLCKELRELVPPALADESGSAILDAIDYYLTGNSYLFRGLHLCAQAHLDDTLTQTDLDIVEYEYLAHLQNIFLDLSSELQAHLMIARKYIALRLQDPSEIVIDTPLVYLRAVGFIHNPDVLERLFAEFSDEALKGDLHDQKRQELVRYSHLPVSGINKPAIQDIFETALGFENLEQIELDLSPPGDDDSDEGNGGILTLSVHDRQDARRYEAEFVHLTISRLGSIAVDFAFNPTIATVSHLRLLETLMAPHMGDIKISWPDLYRATGARDALGQENDTVLGTNFVEQYLIVKECVDDLPDAETLKGYLLQWATLLDDLAQYYSEQQSAITIESKHSEVHDDPSPEALQDLERWENNYRAQNDLIHKMTAELVIWTQVHPDHPICTDVQERVLSQLSTEHFTFTFLKDVAERIWIRFEDYLRYLMSPKPPSDKKADEQAYIWHDYNLGWQSIVSFNKVRKVDHQANTSEQIRDMRLVASHRDYVGLVAGSREARASIDDWRFVVRPPFENLATIRSHDCDLMVASDNRTLLAFPDDPHYIIKQYEITAQVTANIRVIVLGFNSIVKDRLSELEKLERKQEELEAPVARGDHSAAQGP